MKLALATTLFLVLFQLGADRAFAELKAGAAVVDVTPIQFPVFVNGGMTSRSATKVTTKVYARAIVLDDGGERLAIVVVDSCMMPRPLLDNAKQLAAGESITLGFWSPIPQFELSSIWLDASVSSDGCQVHFI